MVEFLPRVAMTGLSVTSKRWDAAPEREWVLTYRRGLSRGKIAEVTGAPLRTVGYHLTVARKLQSGLRDEHEEAAQKAHRPVPDQSMKRLAQLVAWMQESGRHPSPEAEDNKNEVSPTGCAGAARRPGTGCSCQRTGTDSVSCLTGRAFPALPTTRPDGRNVLVL
jgi:hypothetical protein